MEWQPIETAPKCGVEVLLWDGQGYRIATRGAEEDTEESLKDEPMWGCWYEWDYCMVVPTHWMPLPEPPPPALGGTKARAKKE